jgi:hypothetical protein
MEYFKLGKISAAPMGLVLHANTVPPHPQAAALFRPWRDWGPVRCALSSAAELARGSTSMRATRYKPGI